MMTIVIGIEVAKDNHDCFILTAEGEALGDVFMMPNTLEEFNLLLFHYSPGQNKSRA